MTPSVQTQIPMEPPSIPSGEEIYAAIMGPIEPELLPGQVEMLNEKYKNETADEAKARKERYDKAFTEYDKQYTAYMNELEATVRGYQREAILSVEWQNRESEQVDMTNLESAIASA